jgi:ankyrin repeat protein
MADSSGRQPLHISSGMKNASITQALVNEVADLNAKCKFQDSPLIQACRNRQLENIRVLLESGADVNQKGYGGNAPVHIFVTDTVYHELGILNMTTFKLIQTTYKNSS